MEGTSRVRAALTVEAAAHLCRRDQVVAGGLVLAHGEDQTAYALTVSRTS